MRTTSLWHSAAFACAFPWSSQLPPSSVGFAWERVVGSLSSRRVGARGGTICAGHPSECKSCGALPLPPALQDTTEEPPTHFLHELPSEGPLNHYLPDLPSPCSLRPLFFQTIPTFLYPKRMPVSSREDRGDRP